MSQHFKVNTTLLSIIASALGAWGTVAWIASSKANDITTQGTDLRKVEHDIETLKTSDRATNALLQRLDERTILILETVKSSR